jgi:hypothetical protein
MDVPCSLSTDWGCIYKISKPGLQPPYGLKQGDALRPLLFNFALEYAIMKLKENQVRLK